MFEGFKRFWKGFMQMFGYMTLKQIVGKDITPVSYTHLTLPTNREV